MPKSNKKKNKNKNKTKPNIVKSGYPSIISSGNKSDSTESDSDSESGTELLPFVSICTPTFNRRPFIPYLKKCFEHQTYPKDRMEWIIIDDGTDPIEDLVKDIEQVKYFYYEEKMLLGKKRNLMHSKCSGDIIIYMDDDDYYPEQRISHAVETLLENPSFSKVEVSVSKIGHCFDCLNRTYKLHLGSTSVLEMKKRDIFKYQKKISSCHFKKKVQLMRRNSIKLRMGQEGEVLETKKKLHR
jgi:glycosyltransferase involved in cell wall biosynthesis